MNAILIESQYIGSCSYWNLVLKNLSLVLVLTFLGGSLGLLFSVASPKLYKAQSQIFISTPNELESSPGERGHIGILTPFYFEQLSDVYREKIISVKFLNNKELLSGNNYITNNNKDSHYKIVIKK